MTTLRVLVVDDHELFRRNLRALLDGVDGIEVVGEASDGVQAVTATAALTPDVVLMDLHMPRRNGIDAIRHLADAAPHVAVVALTMVDDERSVQAVLHAGARGYLLKGARRDEVVRAVQAAAAGETILGAPVGPSPKGDWELGHSPITLTPTGQPRKCRRKVFANCGNETGIRA
jgi:DNA-binding NarL/FixJ family response regulator